MICEILYNDKFYFFVGESAVSRKIRFEKERGYLLTGNCGKIHIYFNYNDECYWIYLLKLNVFLFSGADRDRTDDLLNAIQALSHLSYGPITLLNLKRSLFSTKLYEPDGVDMLLLAG